MDKSQFQLRVETEFTNDESQNDDNGKKLLKEPADKSPSCKRRKIDQSANGALISHTHQKQSLQLKGPGSSISSTTAKVDFTVGTVIGNRWDI